MRLPVISDADSRDGSSNKDSRLTNMLGEADEGAMFACVRPGLATVSSNSGAGGGVMNSEGVLISVFGTTLGFGSTPSSIGTITAGRYDFAAGQL